MQQPPIDLRMPKLEAREREPVNGLVWLVVIALFVTFGAWIALMVVQGDHDPDAPMTDAQMACFDRELQKQVDSIGTGLEGGDTSQCIPKTPAYAAHPFWYALIAGAVVFVIGRIALFMVRMERSRGY